MLKILNSITVTMLQLIILSSLTSTVRAKELPTVNSSSSATFPWLISQDYEEFSQHEVEGTNLFYSGLEALESRDYDRAQNYFSQAADEYAQCLAWLKKHSPQDMERVEQLYNRAERCANNPENCSE